MRSPTTRPSSCLRLGALYANGGEGLAPGYAAAARLMSSIPAKAAATLFLWALAHHVLAGVRHLLMDVDLGSSLAIARRSAWSVNLLGALLAILALEAIW